MKFVVGDDRMLPGGFIDAVGLFETAALEVFLAVWFDQENWASLSPIQDEMQQKRNMTPSAATLSTAIWTPLKTHIVKDVTDAGLIKKCL